MPSLKKESWRRSLARLRVKPSLDMEERNARRLYAEAGIGSIFDGAVGNFTKVYATRLGASASLLGLLSSVPALIRVFWVAPAAGLVEGSSRPKRLMLAALFANRFCYFLLALVPVVFLRYRPEAAVFLVIITAIPGEIFALLYSSTLAEIVPPTKLARVVGNRRIIAGVVVMVVVLVSGRFLDWVSFPLNYQLLFSLAFIPALVTLAFLARLEGIEERDVPAKPREVLAGLNPRERWGAMLSDRNLRNFLGAIFVVWLGINLPTALYAIYWVRELDISDTGIGLMSTVSAGVRIGAFYFWRRAIDRFGTRPVMVVATAGTGLYPIIMGLSQNLAGLLLASAFIGAFGSGMMLSRYSTLLYLAPAERRPSFIALYRLAMSVANFLSPLAGVALAGVVGIRTVLFIAGTMRCLGAGMYLLLPFRGVEPEPETAVEREPSAKA
jgi:MFS family permease